MPSEAAPAAATQMRRLHPLTLAFAAGEIGRRMIVPALGGGFVAGEGRIGAVLPFAVGFLALFGLVGAAVRFVFFRYALAGDELVLRSGMLSRRHRVIPLARVQNVQLRQGPLQRMFGVAEVRVETAGSGAEPEAALAVLGHAEARALRAELLARRSAARAPEGAAPGEPRDVGPAPATTLLARIGTADLVLAGATSNSAGVLAAGGLWLLQYADRLPWLHRVDPAGAMEGLSPGAIVAATAGLVLAVFFAGWLISIVGAVVRFHGFTLGRTPDELRKRYGLLTVHEGSIPLRRVQAIRVEESLLRRPLGLAALKIETAGGAPGQSGGAEAFVPIARRADVPALVRGVFEDLHLEPVSMERVHPRSRGRAMRRYFLVLAAAAVPVAAWAWATDDPWRLAWLAAALPLPFLLSRWQYRHRGYALAPGYVLARSGVWNRITWIVPDRKLQTVHRTETPFQRRLGLASVAVDTAAGGRQAVVQDLGAGTADRMLETLAARLRHALRAPAPARGGVEAGLPG